MAVIESILATRMKGSAGGSTFCTLKGQKILKSKTKPANPNTAAQQGVRSDFKDLITQWQSAAMTAADKQAFNKLASRDSRPISGYNKFVSLYRDIQAAANTPNFFTGVTGVKNAPNLDIAGTATQNGNATIHLFTATGTYQGSVPTVIAALAISENIPYAGYTTTGFFQIRMNAGGVEGYSGWYPYDVR